MKICPITYDEISETESYSKAGLRLLSPKLQFLNPLPYSAEEQRIEAEIRASRISIQGVQPKFSAILNVKKSCFEVVDRGGKYILKPQSDRFKQLPENEDLTMRLAALVNIETPLHGLTYSKDGSLTYFIRRFDRKGQKEKIHLEDFAQLTSQTRETKYQSSMEKVAQVLDQCTFPEIQKVEIWKRTLFSFLVGNEDMHLKNFSLIVRNDKVELSPAYDLVNSTIVLHQPKDELALPVQGRKSKLNRKILIEYFGQEYLKIPKPVCDGVLQEFHEALFSWEELIQRSFLLPLAQARYLSVMRERFSRLGIGP